MNFPELTPSDKVTVSAKALYELLSALVTGEGHRVRELQATMMPPEIFPDNPIMVLVREYNIWREAQLPDEANE